jgi:hypothetical protein
MSEKIKCRNFLRRSTLSLLNYVAVTSVHANVQKQRCSLKVLTKSIDKYIGKCDLVASREDANKIKNIMSIHVSTYSDPPTYQIL